MSTKDLFFDECQREIFLEEEMEGIAHDPRYYKDCSDYDNMFKINKEV